MFLRCCSRFLATRCFLASLALVQGSSYGSSPYKTTRPTDLSQHGAFAAVRLTHESSSVTVSPQT